MTYYHNPFRYGNPVPPDRFIGRERAKRILFSRLGNGESSAVVGGAHIGKSSLLRYIGAGQSGEHAPVCVDIDCHLLPAGFTPANFWQVVLDQLAASVAQERIQQQIAVVRQSEYGSFTLRHLFQMLARAGVRVALLIDEFDTLLHHPNFNTAEFFGALRALSVSTDCLALIIASRTSIAEMNRRSHEINPLGSPFFNQLAEVRLLPLRPDEVDHLLDHYLAGSGVVFAAQDRARIRRASGGHPFLVQIAAAALFDARAEGADTLDLARLLQQRAQAHFEDIWRHLGAGAQQALLALAQAELGARGGDSAARAEPPDLELPWLADGELHDLIEPTDGGALGWRISARSFAEWVARQPGPARPPAPGEQRTSELVRLWRLIDEHFNDGELRGLCFELGIDYESLPGEEKRSKARELVAACERAGRIPELVQAGRQQRPRLAW